jgi:hypothetical protein
MPKFAHALAVALLLCPASAAFATPPASPPPTLEERVAHGCRGPYRAVAVAKITGIRTQAHADGEARTASVEVVRMVKGEPAQVPAELHEFAPMPMPTDSEPPQLHAGWTYLMFLDAPEGAGWRLLLPQQSLGTHFDALLAQAQAQCAAAATP